MMDGGNKRGGGGLRCVWWLGWWELRRQGAGGLLQGWCAVNTLDGRRDEEWWRRAAAGARWGVDCIWLRGEERRLPAAEALGVVVAVRFLFTA